MTSPTPDDRRCTGTYKRGDKTGQRCERPARTGHDTCYHHRGPDENRCHAHLTNSHPTNPGGPCPNAPMKGQKVCQAHGGRAKQNRAAGERRVAEAALEAKVKKLLASTDAEPVDNPLVALAELAGQATAFNHALAELVNKLGEQIRYESKAGGEQIRAELTLYERSMDRMERILSSVARLKIDERLAVISEQQANKVIEAIDAALVHIGATGEQAVEAKKIAARKLRSVK